MTAEFEHGISDVGVADRANRYFLRIRQYAILEQMVKRIRANLPANRQNQ